MPLRPFFFVMLGEEPGLATLDMFLSPGFLVVFFWTPVGDAESSMVLGCAAMVNTVLYGTLTRFLLRRVESQQERHP
jgi:hypothetical protein